MNSLNIEIDICRQDPEEKPHNPHRGARLREHTGATRAVSSFHLCTITTLQYNFLIYTSTSINIIVVEAGRGAAARGVTAKPTVCGFDPHSRR